MTNIPTISTIVSLKKLPTMSEGVGLYGNSFIADISKPILRKKKSIVAITRILNPNFVKRSSKIILVIVNKDRIDVISGVAVDIFIFYNIKNEKFS